jgi:hypothetical protein
MAWHGIEHDACRTILSRLQLCNVGEYHGEHTMIGGSGAHDYLFKG